MKRYWTIESIFEPLWDGGWRRELLFSRDSMIRFSCGVSWFKDRRWGRWRQGKFGRYGVHLGRLTLWVGR